MIDSNHPDDISSDNSEQRDFITENNGDWKFEQKISNLD